MQPPIIVFDVLGTVVDERGSFRAAMAEALPTAEDAEAVADRWRDAVSEEVAAIARGEVPWRRWDEVLRATLLRTAPRMEQDRFDRLAAVGHRLIPWPDSAAGLAALKEQHDVVALSNAGIPPLLDSFRAGGLQWSTVLSSEMVRSAKPDPRVYRFLLEQLQTDPADVLMVAAHPWDLRAAQDVGMRTAYVRRASEGELDPADTFDVSAGDLVALAEALAGGALAG